MDSGEITRTSQQCQACKWLKDHRRFDFSSAFHQELLDLFYVPAVQSSTIFKVDIQQYLYRDQPFVLNAHPHLFDGQHGLVYGHTKAPSRSLNGTSIWTLKKLPFSGFKEAFGPQNASVASRQVLLCQGGITALGSR